MLSAKTMLEDEKTKLITDTGKEVIVVEKQASMDEKEDHGTAECPAPGISVHVKV